MLRTNIFSLSAKVFIVIDLIEAKGAVGGGRSSVRKGFYGGVYPRSGGKFSCSRGLNKTEHAVHS